MARLSLSVLALCVGAAAGCGSSATPPPRPVQLTIQKPADGSHTLAGMVSVSGTVSPSTATVLVVGRRVAVDRGTFTAEVPVSPGANVLDVLASAPMTTAAMSAVRVYREVTVAVPDVGGDSPSDAAAQLTKLGLVPKIEDSGGFLQSLIPAPSQVCQTDPRAGREVAPGSTVHVHVAKLC